MCLSTKYQLWAYIALVVLVLVHFGCAKFDRDQLFPFGISHGDSTLPSCSPCSSNAIRLKYPLTFLNTRHTQLYVNSLGTISFKSAQNDLPRRCSEETRGRDLIAPYWSNIDTSNGGKIYFRESMNQTIMVKASAEVKKAFPSVNKGISLKSVIIVTWDNVAAEDDVCDEYHNHENGNTFQVILKTDGVKTFVIFYYKQLSWTVGSDNVGDMCYPDYDYPARAGFIGGLNSKFQDILGSCEDRDQVSRLDLLSNMGEVGKWAFRVDRNVESATYCLSQNISLNLLPSPTMVTPLTKTPILKLSVSPCHIQVVENASCTLRNTKNTTSIFPAEINTAKSQVYCFLKDNNVVYGRLRVTLQLQTNSRIPFMYTTSMYVVEPKINVDLKIDLNNSSINMNWNPSILSMNVTTVDVYFLKSYDDNEIRRMHLYSNIPNSGNFSSSDIYWFEQTSISTVQLHSEDPMISRPVCSEAIRLTDNGHRVTDKDAAKRCEHWYANDTGISTEGIESCPPNMIQAIFDDRFIPSEDLYDKQSFHPNGVHYYTQTNPSPSTGARRLCVYDVPGNLIHKGIRRGTPNGSSGSIWEWIQDLRPYCDCCHSSNNCNKYLQRVQSDDGYYTAPHYALSVGSHNFVTFNGLKYTFNGAVEFWLIESKNFHAQVRMEPRGPTNLTSASTALVMDDGITHLQFQVNSDDASQTSILLDEEILQYPHGSAMTTKKSATLSIAESGNMKIVFYSGFTFSIQNNVGTLNLRASTSNPNITKLKGLLGYNLLAPNGTSSNSSLSQIHNDIGLSWMTSPEESIFIYEEGTSWNTLPA